MSQLRIRINQKEKEILFKKARLMDLSVSQLMRKLINDCDKLLSTKPKTKSSNLNEKVAIIGVTKEQKLKLSQEAKKRKLSTSDFLRNLIINFLK